MAGDTIKTDVFIAGGGPVACTFARVFVSNGRQTVIADSGPQLSPRPGEHLKNAVAYQRDIDKFTPIIQGLLYQFSVPPRPGNTVTLDPISFQLGAGTASTRGALNPRQDPYKNLPSAGGSFAVGGMFTHWTNNTPRQHPTLERAQFISGGEWDVLYECAERLVNTHTNVFVNSVRHTVIKKRLLAYYGDKLKKPYMPDDMPMGAERRTDNDEFVYYTGSDTVLGPLAFGNEESTRKLFTILPEHRVKRLVHKAGKIEYAEVDDMIRGKRYKVYANLFVVAAGSVLTPQLLWNSDIRPEALGRYLNEHTFTFTQIVLKTEIVESIRTDPSFRATLSKNDPTDPVPIPIHDPPPMLRVPVSESHPWHTQVHRDSFGFNGVPPDVDSRLILDLRSFGMVEPVQHNRVTFERDIFDKFGMPQPTFHYVLGDADRDLAHNMMTDMVDLAESLGGFLVGSEPRFMPPGASLHVMGTNRMGEKDDGKSVTDPYSRVWGFENLLVGGNGILPTKNACNPTLTSVALAVRSATHVVGKKPDPSDFARSDYA